ncbi:MAG: hypothetical protein HOQ33_07640 [Cupriavidus sp.]|nr:hypothetical protein [Cupriavidus sp.]
MKLSLFQISILGNVLLLAIALFLGWQLASAGARCDSEQATETGKANAEVRRDETKRDQRLDQVTTNTKANARKAVAKTQEQTRARAEAIDRIPVAGDCRRPVGLPPLDAAVDQANAAAGD